MRAVVEANISEIEKLAKKLNAYALSGSQRESLLHDMGVEVREQTLDRFDFETDPDGNPWKKLADATVRYKNKISGGGILERSGLLKQSIVVRGQGPDSVIIGTAKEYAGYHQEGTKKMPERPYFGIGTDNIDDLERVIEKWLKNNFG